MRVRKFEIRKNAAQLPSVAASIAANSELYEALKVLSGDADMAAASLEMILANGGTGITIIT